MEFACYLRVGSFFMVEDATYLHLTSPIEAWRCCVLQFKKTSECKVVVQLHRYAEVPDMKHSTCVEKTVEEAFSTINLRLNRCYGVEVRLTWICS